MSEEQELPDWVLEEMASPPAEGDRNNFMVRIGPTILRCGWDPQALEDKFEELLPDLELKEIHATVKSCVNIAKKEQKALSSSAYAAKMAELEAKTSRWRRTLPNILAQGTWNEEQIRRDNELWKLQLSDQRRLFLSHLFTPQDVVWIGAVYQSGLTKYEQSLAQPPPKPRNAARFMQCQSWLNFRTISGEFVSHCTFKPGSHSRCNDNVAVRKYLVIESDTLAPDEVCSVFAYLWSVCGFTLRAVVSTGGKSLHGWFNMPPTDLDELCAMIVGLDCDPATTRASQPVRLPGTRRQSTGKPQELLYLA